MKIWKKLLQVVRVHLEFIGTASRYVHTHYSYAIGGLQPISRDTDNNAAMYNRWWTNKRS